MDNRSSKRKKKEHDFAVNAFRVFQEAVSKELPPEEEPSPPEPVKNHDYKVRAMESNDETGSPFFVIVVYR